MSHFPCIEEMFRIFTTRITVEPDAIDVNQHVNNLAYLRWMQDAATDHSTAQGWSFERYVAFGSGWFVRSHFIEYLHPAFVGDVLNLHTWVHAMAPRSSPRRYCFVRDKDGEIIAKAETQWVFVNFGSGRPARIPTEVSSSFSIVPEDDPELLRLTTRQRRQTA